MAKRREQPENLEQTKRISPYQQIDEGFEDGDQILTDEIYDDADADEYEYDDAEDEDGQAGGFFSGKLAKILIAVIALLFIVVLALAAVRFLGNGQDAQQLPSAENTPEPAAQTQTPTPGPTAVVFAPVINAAESPETTAEPTPTPTAAPTDVPEPTDTPLPIILTNTPTPSPSPTPTPTATPTLVPTNTPEPTPTPLAEIGTGKVNRNANLRATASSNGKVKQTVKKGEAVTLHESQRDKSGNLWYYLTVDDDAVSGWMRDYVLDLSEKIAQPTSTPKPTAAPEKEAAPAEEEDPQSDGVQDAQQEPAEDAIAAGKANRDANIRKLMNGTVLGTVGKGKTVSIYEVLKDKSGKTWYRLSVDESGLAGYMRDFVIDLEDDDVKLEVVTDAEKASVGTAKTNRDANVRKTPVSNGKLVRQLGQGVKVYILGKYEDSYGQIWYEITTESGNTTGFMRDYVLDSVKLDEGVETKTYTK